MARYQRVCRHRKGRTVQQANTVSAVFQNRADADAATARLREAGFSDVDMSVVYADSDRSGGSAGAGDSDDVGPAGGATAGAATGALVGLTAGPIGAAFGAITGAIVGGISAAMIHLGHGEDDAQWYDEQVQQGGTLVSVNAAGRGNQARELLQASGGTMRETGMGGVTGSRMSDSGTPETGGGMAAGAATGAVAGTAIGGPVGTVVGGVVGAAGGAAAGHAVHDERSPDHHDHAPQGEMGGALAGGAAGAAIGTAVAGPVGTVVGGAIGGSAGAATGAGMGATDDANTGSQQGHQHTGMGSGSSLSSTPESRMTGSTGQRGMSSPGGGHGSDDVERTVIRSSTPPQATMGSTGHQSMPRTDGMQNTDTGLTHTHQGSGTSGSPSGGIVSDSGASETGGGMAAGAATGAVAGAALGGPAGALVGGAIGAAGGGAAGHELHEGRAPDHQDRAPEEEAGGGLAGGAAGAAIGTVVAGPIGTVVGGALGGAAGAATGAGIGATQAESDDEWMTDDQGNRVRRPRTNRS